MIKIESSETATIKLLQENLIEANAMVQSYAKMLSNKYQLPAEGQFTFTPDFTGIIEIPKISQPVPVDVQPVADAPAPPAPVTENRKRKARKSDLSSSVEQPVAQ